MKKLFGLILVLSLVCLQTTICHGAPYWAKSYGWNDWSSSSSMQQTTDGGYIVTGEIKPPDPSAESDVSVLKLDSNGNVTWSKTYGGSEDDVAYSIEQTTDGGYVVAGATFSFGAGHFDLWILKLDSNGNVTWQKTFGGDNWDEARSIQQTTDGGYVVAGFTWSFGNSAWIIKLDSNGDVEWQKTYKRSSSGAYSIQQTADGGYAVAGFSYSPIEGSNQTIGETWIIKLASNGDIVWENTYGGRNGFDVPSSIRQTDDDGDGLKNDGYIVEHSIILTNDNFDLWILKLDSNGNVTWQHTYGGSEQDGASSIEQTPDGGYVVAGHTFSFGAGNIDGWLLKLDSIGNITWQKTYGGSVSESATSIEQTPDGDYVVAGWGYDAEGNDYDAFVLTLDSNGEIPNCNILQNCNATITDITPLSGQTVDVTIEDISVTPVDTPVTPQDNPVEIKTVCGFDPPDSDNDGIPYDEDNCPNTPNGPNLGTCYSWSGMASGTTCMSDADCGGLPDSCSNNQEDTYPPQGNGIGDACDCEGDFNCDGDVDAGDVAAFLGDFGRSIFENPCTNAAPCNGDVNCDGDVDAADVTTFLEDFGRSVFENPCPPCVAGNWCVY